MKIVAPPKMATMDGRNAAIPFPSKISLSVVGVARSGSRLFSTFSPIRLYDAIVVEYRPARMRKKKVNAGRRYVSSDAAIPLPLHMPDILDHDGKKNRDKQGDDEGRIDYVLLLHERLEVLRRDYPGFRESHLASLTSFRYASSKVDPTTLTD